jgi:hypothetical protein
MKVVNQNNGSYFVYLVQETVEHHWRIIMRIFLKRFSGKDYEFRPAVAPYKEVD